MPATATPRKPQTLARKLVETRNTSRNRGLAAMLGLGESEKELARDFGSGLNDVIGRGTLASLIGLPGDLGGLAENGIRSALGMPQVQPYGGSEHIGQKLEEAGLVSPVRRPKTELLASLISPSQAASAAYRAPQMARAGVRMLDNLAAPRTMGSQTGAIENLWHGSPHTFDRFDLSKIGTGEGNQAYGHGVYLAENKDVALDYRLGLGNRPQASDDLAGFEAQSAIAKSKGNPKKAIEWIERRKAIDEKARQFLVPGAYEKRLADYNEAIRRIQSGEVSKDAGAMYQTRLAWPDPAREATDPLSTDHFLHWDKPLSEQSPQVRKALQGIGIDSPAPTDSMSDDDLLNALLTNSDDTGANIYQRIALRNGEQPKTSSVFDDVKPDQSYVTSQLLRQGIPGIRYLDGGSRGAGAGSHNYVVFDDRMIDIVSRNGQPVGNLGKMVAPQDEALRVAQQNAAKPIEEGGLGLRPDNTPEERAAAMGFEGGWYHGTGADIREMNTEGVGKTAGAGAFVTDNPINAETYVPGLGQSGNIMPLMIKRDNLMEVDAKGRRWGDIRTNDLFHKRKSLVRMFPEDLQYNNSVSTDEIAALAPYAGFDGVVIRNVIDNGPNSHIFRAKEYLQQKYGIPISESEDYWSGVTGDQFAEARRAVEKGYNKKSNIIALQKPENIRSRFAAFDPMRRDSSDILAGLAPIGLGGYWYGQQEP